ncbi:MAG TPA: DUF3050 domain-containing protein [Candidatus Dormibacteraeota bacterium]|nr:DUF3050 domain-containing protein [Candidatus Dormibacteraeota bacterium]
MPVGISELTTSEVQSLDDLRKHLEPVRKTLLAHPLYRAVNTLPRLRLFMRDHVFAVWDFMCLAKRLQRDLTCCEELWTPPQQPSLARFINGVVFGEESDVDSDGYACSHFELYLGGMREAGASTEPAENFIALLRAGIDVRSSLVAVGASEPVQQFVSHTLRMAKQGNTIEVLASFLFGREDLIPEMFSRLLPRWNNSDDARRFAYYVKRHIELDGEDHGPSGLRALAQMAEGDVSAWRCASGAAQSAILARIKLWDGVYERIASLSDLVA